jgi:N-acyl-D-glutamate deacylase
MRHRLVLFLAVILSMPSIAAQTSPTAGPTAGPAFDLVIANGRVVDPETGLDAVRSIGIRAGRIAAISRTPLRGRSTLEAAGLVVAPGFIDLHAHGKDLAAARMQAFDGVTTALELEAGALPVGVAYDQIGKEGRPINYGFSASWLFARIAEKEGMEPSGDLAFFQKAQARKGWQHTIATPEETSRILARIERGLAEGALGIGVLAGYAPGHGRKEAFAVAQLAARHGVPTFTHARYGSVIEPNSSFEGLAEIVSLAAATGAHMHINHLNSIATRDIGRIAEMLKGAAARGLRVTTEAYPYGAGSTVVGAELFRGNWRERMGGAVAGDLELAGGSWLTSCAPIEAPPTRPFSTSRFSCPAAPSHPTLCRGPPRRVRRSRGTFGRCPRMRSRIPAVPARSLDSCGTTSASASRSRCARD